jgi:hypothetical protein
MTRSLAVCQHLGASNFVGSVAGIAPTRYLGSVATNHSQRQHARSALRTQIRGRERSVSLRNKFYECTYKRSSQNRRTMRLCELDPRAPGENHSHLARLAAQKIYRARRSHSQNFSLDDDSHVARELAPTVIADRLTLDDRAPRARLQANLARPVTKAIFGDAANLAWLHTSGGFFHNLRCSSETSTNSPVQRFTHPPPRARSTRSRKFGNASRT